jgi:hypothetical protein
MDLVQFYYLDCVLYIDNFCDYDLKDIQLYFLTKISRKKF